MGQNSIASAEEIVGEWTKIVSGNLTGFVKTSELCFNEEAQALGSSLGDVSATVVADSAALYLPAESHRQQILQPTEHNSRQSAKKEA